MRRYQYGNLQYDVDRAASTGEEVMAIEYAKKCERSVEGERSIDEDSHSQSERNQYKEDSYLALK